MALTVKASLNHESGSAISIFTLLPSEPTESARRAAPETPSEQARLMAELAIAYDGRHDQHDGKRHDRLADALHDAKLQRSKPVVSALTDMTD